MEEPEIVRVITSRLRRYNGIRIPLRRLRRAWRGRTDPVARSWSARAEAQWAREPRTYLDFPLDAATHVYGGKAAFLHQVCLALRPRVMVELGSGFSYYDFGFTYEQALRRDDEGLSTRVMLAAARLLDHTGTPAHVYSVDLRNPENLRPRLPADFGLASHLTYALGQDSIEWMRAFNGTVGLLFTDSHHTRRQILGELDAALPKMAARSAILVDNCYTTDYGGEPPEDVARGGKYGALMEWIASHPDWVATWTRHDVVLLSRGWIP